MCKKFNPFNAVKAALIGLIFATALGFTPHISTPVYADEPATSQVETTPETGNNETQDTTETAEETTEESTEDTSCTTQTGAIGWLVCPSTGVLANAIDGIYSIIENFLVISPVSFNTDSPIYIVWDYCRSLTNIVFIIVLLITIFSQVTGLGFSNYNVKKTLPRIIVAAIVINLSFILCSLLVDLSNIAGASLRGIFTGLEETIAANTGYDPALYSFGNVAAAILAGGSIIGVGGGIMLAGGVTAFLWMLIPIILGAIVAVITGLLTISMRQAVVLLLVMISPLAVIAYALPNTEKWFQKWKQLLSQMLIFYPVFSFVFGASELAGFVLISSAHNTFGVLLGLAVQVFPLLFGWQLMKMSGTVLGAINSKLNNLGRKPLGAANNWAGEHRALARAKHVATSRMPSARLNQFLEKNKARRALDTTTYNDLAKSRAAAAAYNPYNRKGQLTRRGEKLYALQADSMREANRLKQYKAEFEEQGYGDNGQDTRVKKSSLKRIASANQAIIDEVDRGHMADSFLESAKTANAVSHASRIEESRNKIIDIRNQLANGQLTQEEADAQIAGVNSKLTQTISSVSNPEERTKYMNNVFANAISAQSKADKALRDNYSSLYAATQLTRNIHAEFNKSFSDKNYNAMEAAIDELAKRGDFDLIRESLLAHSGEIAGDDDVEMQKHLADTLIKYKADSAPLWAYAKSTNIRRAKHAAAPDQVALFTTFEEFERGAAPSSLPTENADVTDSLSMIRLVKEINNPAIAVSQDRTTFKYLLQAQQQGILDAKDMGFQIKQLRSAASSGQMDGEQLGNLNMLLTGGLVFDGKTGQLDTVHTKQAALNYTSANKQAIVDNIVSYIRDMSATQLAGMKESTFIALNGTLAHLMGDAQDYGTGAKGGMSKTFYDAIYTNAASNMNGIIKSNMNTNIKNWLGISSNKQ